MLNPFKLKGYQYISIVYGFCTSGCLALFPFRGDWQLIALAMMFGGVAYTALKYGRTAKEEMFEQSQKYLQRDDAVVIPHLNNIVAHYDVLHEYLIPDVIDIIAQFQCPEYERQHHRETLEAFGLI